LSREPLKREKETDLLESKDWAGTRLKMT